MQKFGIFILLLISFISVSNAACTTDSQCPAGMECDFSMGDWGVCAPSSSPPPAAGTECKVYADCNKCIGGIMFVNGCSNGKCFAISNNPCPSGQCANDKECATGSVDKTPAPVNRCEGVNCIEKFCQGSTRYYNGNCDPDDGKCKYLHQECSLGCSSGECIQEEKIELIGLELSLEKNALVLNGRDAVRIRGTAFGRDAAGNNIPYKGVVRFEASGEASRSRLFGPSVVHVQVDNSAVVNTDGTFSFFASSQEKIEQTVDLTGAKLIIKSTDIGASPIEISLVSPAPVIKKFSLKSKPTVWQDSYGVFTVEVDDPDSNIKEYQVKSQHGEIRLYGVEWGEEKQVTHPSSSNSFEFGWKAPKFTEEMKLDYAKSVYNRITKAVSKIATKAVNDKLKEYALETGGEEGKRWTPSIKEMKKLVEATSEGRALDASDTVAKFILSRSKLTKEAYKKVTEPLKGIYERGEAFVDLYQVSEETTAETAAQAQELGAAYEEDASFFEYVARVGIIGIQGYRMYEGVMTTGDTLAGEEGGDDLLSKSKEVAKDLTIGVMEDSLKFVADNYKAARARMLSLPFIVKIQVTDEDGYTATKGVLVEVEGYERTITG